MRFCGDYDVGSGKSLQHAACCDRKCVRGQSRPTFLDLGTPTLGMFGERPDDPICRCGARRGGL